MRRYLVPALVGLAALALAATAAGIPTAPDGNTQTIRSKVWPVKLPRKQFHRSTLKVVTRTTSTSAENGVPVPATRAIVDFDRDLRLFTRGIPKCSAAKLQSTSTQAALALCGKAKIGAGNATVLLPIGGQVFVEKVAVTAFNGRPKNGRPTLLLHSYGRIPTQVTLVLSGTIRNHFRGGYGPRLVIEIPKIAGGTGALTRFAVAIRKKYRYRGKPRAFINARCRDGKLKVRGKFIFADGESLTDRHVQRCRPQQR
jgi:hypothetical protein